MGSCLLIWITRPQLRSRRRCFTADVCSTSTSIERRSRTGTILERGDRGLRGGRENGAARPSMPASNEEIVFRRSATEAINLVASSFGSYAHRRRRRDRAERARSIGLQHRALGTSTVSARARSCAWVDVADDGSSLEAFERAPTDRTKLSRSRKRRRSRDRRPDQGGGENRDTSGRSRARRSARRARSISTSTCATSTPTSDVFTGHKVYGPTDLGVPTGKRELLEKLLLYQGGGEMIEEVTRETFENAFCRIGFEAGIPPIVQAIGLAAVLSTMSRGIGRRAFALTRKRCAPRRTSFVA